MLLLLPSAVANLVADVLHAKFPNAHALFCLLSNTFSCFYLCQKGDSRILDSSTRENAAEVGDI